MRLVIFSDSHLSVNFDAEYFAYFKDIISTADQVIINGDFWDRYLCSFDEFLNSKWSALFPLLKSKHTIYLFGNHDEQKYSDSRTELFSDQQVHQIGITVDGIKLHIEHGHHIALISSGDEPGTYQKLFVMLESFGRKYIPGSYLTNRILQSLNEQMKLWAHQNLLPDQILVCGHTHIQEKAVQSQFLNSGLNCYGFKQYISITDSVIELHH